MASDEAPDGIEGEVLERWSLECRRRAEHANSPKERGDWLMMADHFLLRAKELDD